VQVSLRHAASGPLLLRDDAQVLSHQAGRVSVCSRSLYFLYITSCKQEFDEKLIDCVHSFSVIYDPSKKSYMDRIAKVNSWKSIATVLERDGKFIVSPFSPTFIQ
jgi:hypothetical protein